MMNEIFADLEDIYVVYIDDLIIFMKSDSKKDHNKVVLEVLCCLEENNLFIKPEKCIFHAKEVELLGMVMGKDDVHMDDSKIRAILKWPKLKNLKGVQSFLELCNNPTSNTKSTALHAECQAVAWRESGRVRIG